MTAFFSTRQSDDIRLCKSRIFNEPDDDVYEIIRCPWKAYVWNVTIQITTAYGDAGATITIGYEGNDDTADPDYFLTSADIDPDAAGFASSVLPMYFGDKGGAITLTCDDNGGTVGIFVVFANLCIIT